MVVGQAFSQQFRAGDVIYGISQSRGPYVGSLPPNVAHHLRSVGNYLICDEYNNRTFGKTHEIEDLAAILQAPGSKHDIKENVEHHEQVNFLNPLQKAALSDYYEALSGSRYAPLQAVKTNLAAATAKGNANIEDLVFRRACKFGLRFAIEQKARTVHFVLDVPAYMGVPGDRLDSLDIATKAQHAGHVPITTSELRACYRNRDAWIPPGRLKFYFNLLEVNPPWVDDPAEWAIYEAHRIQKGRA